MVVSTRTTAPNKSPLSVVEPIKNKRQINNLPKLRGNIEKNSLWGEIGQLHWVGVNQTSINIKKKLITKSIKKCIPPLLQAEFNYDLQTLIKIYDKELFDLKKALAAVVSLRDNNLDRIMKMLENQVIVLFTKF